MTGGPWRGPGGEPGDITGNRMAPVTRLHVGSSAASEGLALAVESYGARHGIELLERVGAGMALWLRRGGRLVLARQTGAVAGASDLNELLDEPIDEIFADVRRLGGPYQAAGALPDRTPWHVRFVPLPEGAIAAVKAAMIDAGLPYDVIREEGPPMEVLAQVWRYHDLCLLGVRGWFDHGVVAEPSNTLLKLISQGVRPLYSVTEQTREIRKVMIAYNGSMESAKAMKQYAQFNLWPDAETQVVCLGKPKSGENADDMLDHAVEYLGAHGIAAEAMHVTGKFSAPVFDHSREMGADLVVMGSNYRRILAFETFGIHARRMTEKSDCALFMSH